MGYNSADYIHTVYQAMNLAFADRDFYYGDPYFPPDEPTRGLLSKEYAKQRAATIRMERNDATAGPGDPYPFQGGTNPYARPAARSSDARRRLDAPRRDLSGRRQLERSRRASRAARPRVIAADAAGLAGVGDAERRLDPGDHRRPHRHRAEPAHAVVRARSRRENPFNVLEPGKRPRVTLTPSLAFKDGKPWLAFAVQGGDTQDQNLLQFFLNVARVRHDAAGGRGGRELQQLPDAQLVRPARVAAGPHRAERVDAAVGARGNSRSAATSSSSRRAPRARSTPS